MSSIMAKEVTIDMAYENKIVPFEPEVQSSTSLVFIPPESALNQESVKLYESVLVKEEEEPEELDPESEEAEEDEEEDVKE